jgi:ubiquinone biosynthesis protein
MANSYPTAARRWYRLIVVVRAAFKHGAAPARDLLFRRPTSQERLAASLRAALEEIGFTYLKLGQFLATRHDIVSPALVRELTNLFEHVPPIPESAVHAVLEAELGLPVQRLFSFFGSTPIAAATVAQVHRATLADGRRVAIKVQRPGIESMFEADIANLRWFARWCDRLGVLGSLSAEEIAEQFTAYTRREFDFLLEASNARRLRKQARPECSVPEIVLELTTRKVLTMQFMEGVSLAHICTLLERDDQATVHALLPTFDRKTVLENLTRVSLHQFFVTGFFHGDPHPGNILVREDNTVVLLDFGIFGELSPTRQKLLAGYAEYLAIGNVAESFRYLSQIYFPSRGSDRHAFRQDAIAALRRWHLASRDTLTPMRARHLGGSFDAMVAVVRRHHYSTVMDFLLFWRAIIVLDSIALRLDSEFDLAQQMRSFFQDLRPPPIERAWEILKDPHRISNVRHLIGCLGSGSRSERPSQFHSSFREAKAAQLARQRRIGRLVCAMVSSGLLLCLPAVSLGSVVPVILVAAVAAAAAVVGWTYER